MIAAIVFAAVDSTYLTWRYVALRLAVVVPGSSICSWTTHIDCDRVLLSPEANALFVPNALLGSAFYIGCLIWWGVGKRLGPSYQFYIVITLTFWLGVASIGTLYFFWLLVQLSYFCPVCPLNHLATYAALAFAIVHLGKTPTAGKPIKVQPLCYLVLICVLFFVSLQLLWYLANTCGVFHVAKF
jgi:uncharacterized membrane protein